jgi:hypothetical protein
MAGFEPERGALPGCAAHRIAQLEMAPLTRIELAATRSTVEPRHQLGPGASCSFCNNGAAAESRTRMHKARAPQARVSTVPPRPRNCLFEVPTFRRTTLELEDQVGLEPTVTCVDGLRIRSLSRWGYWSMIGGSGWFRTTCARVKRPLHLQSGLTLRIHRLDDRGGKPRRFRRACLDGIAPFRQSRDSDGHVGLPSVGAPVRNRTCINRLSSGRTAIVLQERELVRFHGIEPRTTAMSRRYSTSELKAHDWYPRLGSNERMSVCKTDALPLGYGSVLVRAEGIEPPRASPSQSECGASTSFATLALRIEDDTRRLVLTGGLESPRFGLQNRCSPSELRQH